LATVKLNVLSDESCWEERGGRGDLW